ncbi:hypothetical protein ACFQ07_15185, partial [Actinomadura adrarensis]
RVPPITHLDPTCEACGADARWSARGIVNARKPWAKLYAYCCGACHHLAVYDTGDFGTGWTQVHSNEEAP